MLRSHIQPPFRAARRSRLFQLNDPRNGARKPAPVVGFFFELSPPEPCKRIVFRPPAILGRFPFGCNPALLLQLVQSRVERSVAHLQHVAGYLLQPLTDGEAVQRLKGQDFQQQHVQRALHQIRRFAHYVSSVTETSTSSLRTQVESFLSTYMRVDFVEPKTNGFLDRRSCIIKVESSD